MSVPTLPGVPDKRAPGARRAWRSSLLIVLLAGCSARDGNQQFFPLESGMHWQYRVQRITMDGTHELRYAISTRPSREFAGAAAAVRETIDGRRYFYQTTADGIFRVGMLSRDGVDERAAKRRELVLPTRLSADAHWQGHTQTTVLENTGPPWETLFRITVPVEMRYAIDSLSATVVTPAGTFSDCLVVSAYGKVHVDVGNYIGRAEIEVTSTEWFAPNVGLVRLERVERTDASALDYGKLIVELDDWQSD